MRAACKNEKGEKQKERKDLFSLNPINQCRGGKTGTSSCCAHRRSMLFFPCRLYECVSRESGASPWAIKHIFGCLCHCGWVSIDWIDVCCVFITHIHFDHLTGEIVIIIGFFISEPEPLTLFSTQFTKLSRIAKLIFSLNEKGQQHWSESERRDYIGNRKKATALPLVIHPIKFFPLSQLILYPWACGCCCWYRKSLCCELSFW